MTGPEPPTHRDAGDAPEPGGWSSPAARPIQPPGDPDAASADDRPHQRLEPRESHERQQVRWFRRLGAGGRRGVAAIWAELRSAADDTGDTGDAGAGQREAASSALAGPTTADATRAPTGASRHAILDLAGDLGEPAAPPVPPITAIAESLPLPDPDPDAEEPEEAAEVRREAEEIAWGGPFSRFAWPSHPRYWNGYLAVLTGLATLSFLMFLLMEPSPRWILLVAAGGVGAGLDGVLRATWRTSFASGEDTTPSLFLPVLYVFAAPLLIEHNAAGHWVLLWGVVAGIGFGAIAVAEVLSVRTGSPLYGRARTVTRGAAYCTAFSLLAMTNVLHLGLAAAVAATWLVGTMLAVEVVREGEVDPVETVIFAALAGLVVAQVRWLLHFLPVEGYTAGLTLVLVFYLATGVLHSYVVRQLTVVTAVEYTLVAIIGGALVLAARAAGLA